MVQLCEVDQVLVQHEDLVCAVEVASAGFVEGLAGEVVGLLETVESLLGLRYLVFEFNPPIRHLLPDLIYLIAKEKSLINR